MLKPKKSVVRLLASRYGCIIIACALVCFGFSVVIGWHGHIDTLIRYKAGTIAIVYNSALLFILGGICIITSMYNMRYIPTVSAIIMLSFGVLGLVQHLFSINLGIDQLFFQHYDTYANLFPGRMAPNTSLCFTMMAIALLLITNYRLYISCLYLSVAISMLTFSMSLVFISGYFSTLQQAYAWGHVTPMSTNAAVGFVLMSAGVIFLSAYKSIVYDINLTKTLPLLTSLSVFVATLLLVEEIGEQELINNYSSNLPIVTFVIGVAVALLIGVLLRLVLITLDSACDAKQSLSLIQTTLEATVDGVIVVNLDGGIVVYNQRFVQMWGLSADKMEAHNRESLTSMIVGQLKNKEKYYIRHKQLALDPSLEAMDELILKNGNILERHVRPQILDENIIGRVFCYRDVTLQKRLENQLLHQATYDTLTGLPNRALLLDLINRAIQVASKGNKIISILLIDIDKFSHINDLFGRSKGDVLLKDVALRLNEHLPSDAILGRIGGDEFLVIYSNTTTVKQSILLINILTKSLDKSFDLYGHELKITVSIGGAFYPKDGKDGDVLLSNADIAILRSKKVGRNDFQFYSQDMNSYTLQNIELETELHRAIKEEQFVVYYQPIVDLKKNKPVGVEALVRWKHPLRGIVAPIEFIPMAEEIGLIQQIGEWVLRNACAQVKMWHAQGFNDLKLSVNISAQQFKYGNLVENVKDVLAKTKIDPILLELELTESMLIGGDENIINTLRRISGLGTSISIDDFGTGYSSFSYVKRFPINKIKIDRSFISDINKSDEDKAIVRAMVAMGKGLSLTVLAEGIETTEQLDFLQGLDCDLGQGYYFSKPLTVDDCEAYFNAFSQNNSD